MKKLNFLLSSLILAGSTLGNISTGQPALIKVDLDRTIGAIDPNTVFKDIPYLDVTAVLNETDGKVVVNAVNRSETDAIAADIELQSGAYTGKGQVHLINADSIEATNTGTEEKVRIETSALEFSENRISHTFPAHSLTQLEIALAR